MQLSWSGASYEHSPQTDEHNSKYIKTGSLANLSLNQARKAINYVKGERQVIVPQNSVQPKINL